MTTGTFDAAAHSHVESPSQQAAIGLENRSRILARTAGELGRAAKALIERRKRRGG